MEIAIATFISGLISAYIVIRFNLDKDIVVIKRERIEKYAIAIFDIDKMLNALVEKYLFYSDSDVSESAVVEIEMLTSLYFGNVKNELNDLKLSIAKLRQHLLNCKVELLNQQSANGNFEVKVVPTQSMLTQSTANRLDVDDKKQILLNKLLKEYPLFEKTSWSLCN